MHRELSCGERPPLHGSEPCLGDTLLVEGEVTGFTVDGHLDALSILIEAEQFLLDTVLADRPAVVVLVIDEACHHTVGSGDFVAVAHGLRSIEPAVLPHDLLCLSHVGCDGVVASPELHGVEDDGIG